MAARKQLKNDSLNQSQLNFVGGQLLEPATEKLKREFEVRQRTVRRAAAELQVLLGLRKTS